MVYQIVDVRLEVRTPASEVGNVGSIPTHWRDNEWAVGADLVIIEQAGSGSESPNSQTQVSYLLMQAWVKG